MGWRWAFEAEAGRGAAAAGSQLRWAEVSFPSQGEAETWLSEVWPQLAAEGVSAVRLFEEGRLVYGPMSLRP